LVALACLRLCHAHLLWSDEDYHLAAAIKILHGQIPYRDFWYDKPPLSAIYYLIVGGYPGWCLRFLDAAYVVLASWTAYRLARAWWGDREGRWAGLLLAFFTTFYLPAAVIPFAPDALLLAPHLAAIYFAQQRRPVWAGFFCGIGLLINVKAAFVFAVCLVWLVADLPLLLAGFAAPLLAFSVWLTVAKAWAGFYEQVWRWGLLYAQGAPSAHSLELDLTRIAGWLGFHSVLALAAAFAFSRGDNKDRLKLAAWLALSFAAVCLGNHFAPRYFLQVLPPLVIVGSRGIVLALNQRPKLASAAVAALLLIPFIRFAPRYFMLAGDDLLHREPHWSDVAMDLDSQRAAAAIRARARPGDTLFVWGYRPDLYVYTRMTSDSRFWDSQPLTGVPADRHLSATTAVYSAPAARNRDELVKSHPAFIVDGLGTLNPALRPGVYPELLRWLEGYRVIARTNLCVIYQATR
jgi:hypothetical protein